MRSVRALPLYIFLFSCHGVRAQKYEMPGLDAVAKLRTHAIAIANAGRLQEALKLFQEAATAADSSQEHNNVCVTAMRLRDWQLAKQSCVALCDTATIPL